MTINKTKLQQLHDRLGIGKSSEATRGDLRDLLAALLSEEQPARISVEALHASSKAYEEGRADERAAIVAWQRRFACCAGEHHLVTHIEEGAHTVNHDTSASSGPAKGDVGAAASPRPGGEAVSQSHVKPLTAEERAELRRLAIESDVPGLEDVWGVTEAQCNFSGAASPSKLLALLDALDEAEARAERYREVLETICNGTYAGSSSDVAYEALAAEYDTKEDGDGE